MVAARLNLSKTQRFGSESWFRRSPGNGEVAVRLVCFAHAGGGASSFNHWRRVLPGWVELLKVQLPGREDSAWRQPCNRMSDVIAGLSAEVESILDRPLVLYGHSLGAIIAFEFVRELRRMRLSPPLALFVSGRRAPHKPPRRLIHDLPELELVKVLQEMGGSSSALLASPRWRAHYLATIRADLELSDSYTYCDEQPLSCPLYAYLGDVDQLVHRSDWMAWSEQAAGIFERGHLPGGHFFTPYGQTILIRKIVEPIERLLERRSQR